MALKNGRRVVHGRYDGNLTSGTSYDVAAFVLPANREIKVHEFRIVVDDVLASSTITLVNASNSVQSASLTLSLANTGVVRDTLSASETVRLTNSTTSDTHFKLRVTAGASATVGFWYELHIDEPGI